MTIFLLLYLSRSKYIVIRSYTQNANSRYCCSLKENWTTHYLIPSHFQTILTLYIWVLFDFIRHCYWLFPRLSIPERKNVFPNCCLVIIFGLTLRNANIITPKINSQNQLLQPFTTFFGTTFIVFFLHPTEILFSNSSCPSRTIISNIHVSIPWSWMPLLWFGSVYYLDCLYMKSSTTL